MSRVVVILLALIASIGAVSAGEFGSIGVFVQLQFSPDGRYVLAQDDTDIAVLTVEPLHVLFRVQADQMVLGHFTPDSRELVFVRSTTQVDSTQIKMGSGNPRVERWNIRDRTRVGSAVIPSLLCGTTALAPDGRTLACDDLKGTVHVVDVQSGKEVFKKKKFALPYSDPKREIVYSAKLGAADFEFSPDGRFLIAVPKNEGTAVIWDSREGSRVKASGDLKLLSDFEKRTYFFAFLGGDRLVTVRPRYITAKKRSECDAVAVGFPSGHVVASQHLPMCPSVSLYAQGSTAQRVFRSAADPRFLIVNFEESVDSAVRSPNPWSDVLTNSRLLDSGPINGGARLGAQVQLYTRGVELSTGRMIPGRSRAIDVFQNRYVEEIRPGVVGLRKVGGDAGATATVSRK